MNRKLFLLLILVSFSCAHKKVVQGYDRELSRLSYPYPVKYFSFTSQKEKLRMAYLHEVPVQPNGRTVLLLHGKNFGAWYWKSVMQELLIEGFSVIAPDQIGFGKSTKPDSYQYSFQELALNTKNLLDSLNVKSVSVVGHSMGGMLATRFALMYPELTHKLVLFNPIGLEDWKTLVPYKAPGDLYQGELKATAESIREYQRMSYYAGNWKPEYEEMIEPAKGQLLHPDYPVVAWNSALTSDMIFTQPVVYEFPRIKVNTLLIIGTRDRTAIGKDRVPEKERQALGNYEVLGRNTQKMIPGSKLVELPGIGHMPMVENFDGMMRPLLDFIRP